MVTHFFVGSLDGSANMVISTGMPLHRGDSYYFYKPRIDARSTYPFPRFRRNRSSGLESDNSFFHIASLEDLLDDSSRVFIRDDSELLVSWASSVLVRRRAVNELESKRIDLLWCFVNILARITVIKNTV
jgi:hypothetical protein